MDIEFSVGLLFLVLLSHGMGAFPFFWWGKYCGVMPKSYVPSPFPSAVEAWLGPFSLRRRRLAASPLPSPRL